MKGDRERIYRGMKGVLRDEGILDNVPRGRVIQSKDDIRKERKRNKSKKWHIIDAEDDM